MLFPRNGERKRALLARLTGLFGPTRPPPDTPHPARRGLFFPAEDRSTAVLSASSSPDLIGGGLWRQARRQSRSSSCAAGRSVAAGAVCGKSGALRGGLWRLLPISKPRALWGSSCAAGRSVAAGALCGKKK